MTRAIDRLPDLVRCVFCKTDVDVAGLLPTEGFACVPCLKKHKIQGIGTLEASIAGESEEIPGVEVEWDSEASFTVKKKDPLGPNGTK